MRASPAGEPVRRDSDAAMIWMVMTFKIMPHSQGAGRCILAREAHDAYPSGHTHVTHDAKWSALQGPTAGRPHALLWQVDHMKHD